MPGSQFTVNVRHHGNVFRKMIVFWCRGSLMCVPTYQSEWPILTISITLIYIYRSACLWFKLWFNHVLFLFSLFRFRLLCGSGSVWLIRFCTRGGYSSEQRFWRMTAERFGLGSWWTVSDVRTAEAWLMESPLRAKWPSQWTSTAPTPHRPLPTTTSTRAASNHPMSTCEYLSIHRLHYIYLPFIWRAFYSAQSIDWWVQTQKKCVYIDICPHYLYHQPPAGGAFCILSPHISLWFIQKNRWGMIFYLIWLVCELSALPNNLQCVRRRPPFMLST